MHSFETVLYTADDMNISLHPCCVPLSTRAGEGPAPAGCGFARLAMVSGLGTMAIKWIASWTQWLLAECAGSRQELRRKGSPLLVLCSFFLDLYDTNLNA